MGWSAGRTRHSVVVWLAGLQHDVLAVARAARADVEALIVILIDEHVFGVGRVPRVWRQDWNWRFCSSSSTE